MSGYLGRLSPRKRKDAHICAPGTVNSSIDDVWLCECGRLFVAHEKRGQQMPVWRPMSREELRRWQRKGEQGEAR